MGVVSNSGYAQTAQLIFINIIHDQVMHETVVVIYMYIEIKITVHVQDQTTEGQRST